MPSTMAAVSDDSMWFVAHDPVQEKRHQPNPDALSD